MINAISLYKFQNLRSYLKGKGYPDIKIDRDGFMRIRGLDFKSIFKAGDVSFDDEGIYVHIMEKKYKGYMFMQKYSVRYDPKTKKFPKFHLLKCPTIEQHLKQETFIEKYVFAVSRKVNVQDKYSSLWYYDRKLDLCENCKKSLTDDISVVDFSTENFFNMEKDNYKTEKVRVDMNGYVFGWAKISKTYRLSKNFTCENCSISPKDIKHQIYWDSHHMGDKLKNDDKDLKCLCKLCHKHVDSIHENEMKNKIVVNQFINLYKKELISKGNPYIYLYI